MRVKTYKFYDLSIDYKIGLKDYGNLFINGESFKNFLKNRNYVIDMKSGRTPSKFNPDYWGGEYEFITMADVDNIIYRLNRESKEKLTDDAINNEKNLIKVPKNSLIISSAMTLGLAFINDRDVYINQNVFWVNLNEELCNKKFILWYFNTYVRKQFSEIYSAKYLSKLELSRINIPKLSIEIQNKFENKIKEYEGKIDELLKKKKNINEIVNAVFSSEFHFDKNLINKVRKGMTYGTQSSTNNKLSIFYNNIGKLNGNKIRLSARANSPIIHEIYKVLDKYGTINLKDVVYENIHRGKSPNYDKNGSISVIKTAHITNNGISNEYEEFVNEDFYNKKIDAQVKKGDILLASTGKPSIGKIDIFEDDYQAIPDGHISIIRINPEKYNRKFFVYYIRSVLGYMQIEKDYVGCTNQIELYPEEIGKILLPDITLKRQEEIVEKIDEKIKEQNEIENQIIEEQEKIEKILLEIIK